jgi:hypothetical protein
MKKAVFILCVVLNAAVPYSAPAGILSRAGGKPFFTWDLLWSGSWEYEKKMNNRGDLRLNLPKPGLSLRTEYLDRRPSDGALWDPDPQHLFDSAYAESGTAAFASGLYHRGSGSRFLWGALDEWGLSARLRNPWLRSIPFAENHKSSMAELKTEVSSTKTEEAYLYLGIPYFNVWGTNKLRLFASAQTDLDLNYGMGSGFDIRFTPKTEFRFEALYTYRELTPQKVTTWFSNPPPLPVRDFQILGFGALFSSPYIAVSSDWALSETWAWGRGLYGNLGLQFIYPGTAAGSALAFLRNGRWTLSLAADGADARYTARDGKVSGAAFRAGGKLERTGKRRSLFRLSTNLRAGGFGEHFNRSSSALYYYFPGRVVRLSVSADRNAVDREKILDKIESTGGLTIKQFAFNTSASLNGTAAADDMPSPYPVPQYQYQFDSARITGELAWSPRGKVRGMPFSLQLKTKWGYSINEKKENTSDAAFNMSARVKYGRVSVKIASPEFPSKWAYTISWRVEK